jgi:NAD(P)-dependent dehydrogenase (short-subunit alcohol dehydrogenase family)
MLKDKLIIVAGGNGLLGREIITQILQNGGKAINLDIGTETSLEKDFVNCNITIPSEIDSAFNLISKHVKEIHGFINCAYPRTNDWGKKMELVPFNSWQQNIDMQLNSTFYISRMIAEKMKTQGFGSIVHLSSIYGIVGPDFSLYEGTEMTVPAAYSAIKGAIINFTRYMAAYYGPHRVRVNCLTPGGIFDNQRESFVKAYEKKVPLKRMGKAEDIAPAACFLLSDQSSYVTGHNLVVDGGWTAI